MDGGTRYQNLHQFYSRGKCDRTHVNAQKNFYHTLYKGIPQEFKPNWEQTPYGNTCNGECHSNYPMRSPINHTFSQERRYFLRKTTSVAQNTLNPPTWHISPPHPRTDQRQASPNRNSDIVGHNGQFREHYQQFQNGGLSNPHIQQGGLFNGGRISYQHPVIPSPQVHNFPPYSMVYDHQHTMPPKMGLPMGAITSAGAAQFVDNHNGYTTEPNGFYYESKSLVTPQANYSQVTYVNDQTIHDPVIHYGYAAPASTNYNNTQHSPQPNCLADSTAELIQHIAYTFVDNFCPRLGECPYCFPPIKRHLHTDKQLVLAMESEKRVLGSFEQFFTEQQIPAFMLCHYPLSGFMQNFHGKTEFQDRDSTMVSGTKSVKDTVTLLLLSDIFGITVVTVSIISGNSDLAYIQRGLQKACLYNKRCTDAVTSWLNFLRIRSEVKQVIAFPNLKRAMLNRIRKEKQLKQSYGLLCTLHADELPTPFDEEGSSDVRKQLFSDWIQRTVLQYPPSLSREELHLVVGSLLSPMLSKVDSAHYENIVSPIAESTNYTAPSQQVKEDVSQLKLTVGGLTKPFDQFMDEYVACYYPHLDEQTYRVPPIHFNIQSFKKPSDYLETLKGDYTDQSISTLLEKNTKAPDTCCMNDTSKFSSRNKGSANSQFMPPCRPFVMTATKSSCCSNRADTVNDNQKRNSCSVALSESQRDVCLEALQGVKVLMEVMTKDVRADEGENRVITVLEMLGRRYGPMFIICGYQYNNYLNKLREEMFPKDNTNRPIRAFGQTMRAEHDCLIFHKKYGAIIVCIKAVGDNFEDWSASEEQKIECTQKILEKAVKQLDREEAMIRHVTSDLHANLACHKLIALPNMTRENVEKALRADDNLAKTIRNSLGHGVENFLCSDELPPQHQAGWDYGDNNLWEKLKNWWKNAENLFRVNSEGITSEIYRQLVGRYCGLFSTVEVWSPANIRVEVRSASEAINICAARFRKMILLPHQIKALCSNDKRVFIYGPPGSGKTLLLILKAKEWLLAGESVILINSRAGSEHGFPYAYGVYQRLRQMMKESQISFYKLDMINIDSLSFKATDLSTVMPSSCIIMDELNPAAHDIVEHLSCLQVQKMWCAGLFEDYIPVTAHSFSSHKMNVILRCPPIVQSLLKQTEQDVRPLQPYKKNYQTSVLVKDQSDKQQNNPFSGNGNRSNSDPEIVKHSQSRPTSAEFANKMVADTASKLEDNSNCLSSNKYSYPEDMEIETNKNPNNSSKLLNERLLKKFGNAQVGETQSTSHPGATSVTDSFSATSCHFMWSPNSSKFRKLFPDNFHSTGNHNFEQVTCDETLDYDPESLNRRLMEKYNSEPQKHEERQKTRLLRTQKLSSQDETHASELLNLRLINKYSSNRSVANVLQVKGNLEKTGPLLENSIRSSNYSSDDDQNKKLIPEKVVQGQDVQQKDSTEELPLDSESLSDRLKQKYGVKSPDKTETNNVKQVDHIDASYYRLRNEVSLPTDGPRPHIINHSFHINPGNPTDCFECGNKVAAFLKEMIKPEDTSTLSKMKSGKNNKRYNLAVPSGNRLSGKTGDTIIFSNMSSIHSKLPAVTAGLKHGSSIDRRALNWSDVLIVAKEMPKDCRFLSALRNSNIPVKILMTGQTSEIENNIENKLFITSYMEVTGLERALIIFVPSEGSNSLQESSSKTDIPDLELGHGVKHLTEEDRIALWYVASRSLASLVLILP